MKKKVLQKRLLVAAMTGALAFSNVGMPTMAVFAEEGIETLVSARNVLADGTWDFWTGEGGAGSIEAGENGDAVISVTEEGNQKYAVQYTQNLNLENGTAYRLTGDFYSEDDAVVFIEIQETLGWSSIINGNPYQVEIKGGETTHVDITTREATANFVTNGKLALMFGNGTGNAGKDISVSNMSLVALTSEDSGEDTGSGSETGNGEDENSNTPGENTGTFDGTNELTKGVWDFWTGEGGAGTIAKEDNGDAVVSVTAEGNTNYAVQYTQELKLTEGKCYQLTGDFYSEDDAVVFINLQESLGWSSILKDSPYRLEIKAGETTHLDITTNAATANYVTSGKLALMFGNGTGNAGKSIKVSNMSLVEIEGSSESGEETPETGDADVFTDGYVDFKKADTELYVGTDWSGANAEVKEEGTRATIDAENFGWGGEWGLQYIIKNVGFKNYTTYTISFDMTSSVDKSFFLKVDDAGGFISETVNLTAGKTLHYEKTIDCQAFSAKPYIFFALGQMTGEDVNRSGEIVLENLSVKEAEQEAPTQSKGNEYDFNNPDNDKYNYADPGNSKDGYDLIWADEFDGNYDGANVDPETGLNLDNWAAQLGDGTTDCNNYGWGNNELQSYTANKKNVGVNEDLSGDGVSDGVLRITAAYEPGYVYGTEGAKNYTSARLRTTKGSEALFNTTYGYIESRIALPATAGAWPAFWMLPQSTEVYGGWPVSGEIDIMETCGAFNNEKDNIACGTLHWGVPGHTYKGSGYVDLFSPYTYFHTYAIDWQPGEITWYYDGQPINTLSTWEGTIGGSSDALGFDAPFDMPFYMLLNLAVDSGQFGGAVNRAAFNDEMNMYVDYVRVYQKSEGYPESASRQNQGGSAEDWTELAGINQITEIKTDNLVDCKGGMDDAASDYANWYLATQPDVTDAKIDSYTDADGKDWAHLNIPTAGGLDYSVQLIGHYNAKKGYAYRVSFDAYGSGSIVGKEVAYSSKEWSGWSSYIAKTFKLSTTPATYTYDFVQTEDFEKCRAEFNFGARGTGDVYVSNVKIEIIDPEEIGSAAGPRQPLANGNIIYNGSFDQGDQHLGYWNAANGTTLVVPRYTTESLKDGDKAVVDVASKTNYEHIADGVKYYERRAQISSANGNSPAIYQGGLDLKADTYTVSFDMYSADDTVVKASIYSLEMQGETVALGKELGHAAANYSKDNGVRTYTLVFDTQEDAENAALVLTFGKGASVQVDNVYMKGENQASSVDEHPLADGSSYRGDNGGGVEIPLTIENGVITMSGITSGGTWYSPQLATNDFKLVAGQTYELSFDYKVSGTSNGTFQYIVQENGGGWYVYDDGPTTVRVADGTPDEDGFITYTRRFTSGNTVEAVHLNFGFGNSGAVGDMTFSFRNAKIDLVKGEAGGQGSNDAEEVDDSNFDEPETGNGTETGEGGESGSGEEGGETGEGGNGEVGPGTGDEGGEVGPGTGDEGGETGEGGNGEEGGNDDPSDNKPVVPPVVEVVQKAVAVVVKTVQTVVKTVAKTVAKVISSIFKRWF